MAETVQRKEYWMVYKGVNHSLKEIYYGVTSRKPWERISEHCEGRTEAIQHWDCGGHKIHWYLVEEDIDSQTFASLFAHIAERLLPPLPGYRVIQTAGI